jgi:hypothetical protein
MYLRDTPSSCASAVGDVVNVTTLGAIVSL